MLVAADDGAVAGYLCVLSRVPSDEPADGVAEEARVVDLFVVEAARGRGIARSLLDAAVFELLLFEHAVAKRSTANATQRS